jgi:exonuclease SbcC
LYYGLSLDIILSMIPIHLSLAGFLSYHDPVEIDFRTFELACISGPNGAGKSSLLDAITWALFGQARKRDDSLINTQSDTAEVVLTFDYEGNRYRILRTKTRGKSMVLEFHIRQGGHSPEDNGGVSQSEEADEVWKPLTEHTLRDTQAQIESIMRLDYETFINAAFFLQGKADQFTQQRPGDRKRILSTILGLEIWEVYRARAGEQRREVQAEVDTLDGRLQEIESELAEEEARKAHLAALKGQLDSASKSRSASERALDSLRQIAASLAEQKKLVTALDRQLEDARQVSVALQDRHAARLQEQATYAETLALASEIENAYQAWREARAELARWEEIAARFREYEERRSGPRQEIETARAYLEAEQHTLLEKQSAEKAAENERKDLENILATAEQDLAAAEGTLARRLSLEESLREAREAKSAAAAENPLLKAEMEQLKQRIDQLDSTEGAVCPLCGQPLSPPDRESLIDQLTTDGQEKGTRYRANKQLLEDTENQVLALENQVGELAEADAEVRAHTREVDQLKARLADNKAQAAAWVETGAPRLTEIQRILVDREYAPEAQAQLAEIDAELIAIGYDAAAHDTTRRAETVGRDAEEKYRELDNARATLAPLAREITELEDQIRTQEAALTRQQDEHTQAAASLGALEAQAPDVETAEQDLYRLQEEENRLRMEVGAAQQKVAVLDDLKTRKATLAEDRETLAQQIGQYKQLERAFGKDGVPALLIEQALPQIETRANELLDRLSGGSMSVRFATQTAYKDSRRSDLKETLDILISDSAGTRDYEMYSGGEAFRVNFAIRLALSEVLAQRAGARLQTLVIDEGFGSQDTAGRQRLLEAINLVRPDFAKILVITHIDELKDAFPFRLEVEKTATGSAITLI